MTDYYEAATVDPVIPKHLLTDLRLNALSDAGFAWDDVDNAYYFYVPESLDESEELEPFAEIFQTIIRDSNGALPEIVIVGATLCSKYRSGAFGGFVYRITESLCQAATTGDIVDLM